MKEKISRMKLQIDIPENHYAYLEKYFVARNKAKTKSEIEALTTSWLLKIIENKYLEQYRKEALEEAEENLIK